jgi:hypothetical protein
MTTQSETGNGRRISLYWGAAFVIGTFGTGTLARYFQLDGWLTMAVMIPPMLLLIPFLRSVERANIQAGNSSPAMQRYNRRALIFAFGYMAALFAAIGATDMFKPQGAVAWVLAILPSLPIAYMVYAMGRYLTEEDDEYLRMKAASAALIATGLLLVVATTWGFLESFGLVPHQPGWWAVPVWAVGLGLGQLVMKARES